MPSKAEISNQAAIIEARNGLAKELLSPTVIDAIRKLLEAIPDVMDKLEALLKMFNTAIVLKVDENGTPSETKANKLKDEYETNVEELNATSKATEEPGVTSEANVEEPVTPEANVEEPVTPEADVKKPVTSKTANTAELDAIQPLQGGKKKKTKMHSKKQSPRKYTKRKLI